MGLLNLGNDIATQYFNSTQLMVHNIGQLMSTEAENTKHAINDTTQADHKYRINELVLREVGNIR